MGTEIEKPAASVGTIDRSQVGHPQPAGSVISVCDMLKGVKSGRMEAPLIGKER
jgi:hypothetical protein